MYPYFLFFHSLTRWLVLSSLLYSLARGFRGLALKKAFTPVDDAVRHITATIAHVQLVIGYFLYFEGPHPGLFFRVIHVSLMTLAIVLITAGSSLAKRQAADRAKFRTMVLWFGLALLIIGAAIPWPFSPLAQRPYIRTL